MRGLGRLAQPDAAAVETVVAALIPGLRLRERLLLAGAPALAGLIGHVLKLIFDRQRPGWSGFGRKGEQSFPSTHVGHTAALAFAAGEVARRNGHGHWGQAAAALVTVAVGVSRVRQRAHWPTDVLVGMVVGLVSARVASLVTADRPAPRAVPRLTAA